jgi:F-type H+-transporting ATPase subunit a
MMADVLAASSNPLTHVVDHPWMTVNGITLLSNHIIMKIVAARLLILIVPRFARRASGGDEVTRLTPRGGGNALDPMCVFLRECGARPSLGHYTDTFIPYVWTVFFFILTINILGLLPLEPITKPIMGLFGQDHGVYGTATGNIWTTATLASCSLVMIIANGLRLHGMSYV